MARLKGVIVVFVLLCLGVFAYGCGGNDEASQDQLDQAREEGKQEAQEEAKLDELEQQINNLRKKSRNHSGNSNRSYSGQGDGYYSNAGGPVSTCATGVQVGSNTSCAFAMNVAGEYGSNPGASSISAYSPVTGQYYTMSCGPWSGGGTVCTGGNNASVYLP